MLARQISGFIISNRGFVQRSVRTNPVISADMNVCIVRNNTIFLCLPDAVKGIDINNIFITQIIRVLVSKGVVFSGYGKIPDTIARKNSYLHAIIIDI